MELYQLQYFETVCRLKNYTRASEELMVSQPAVSVAIKKLEDEFGGELIDRTKKVFTLTEMGEIFFKRCEHINSELQAMYKEMSAFTSSYPETVTAAFPTDICTDILYRISQEFLTSEPSSIPLYLCRKDQSSIIKELIENKIDLGIVCSKAARGMENKLGLYNYKTIEFFACVSPDSDLAAYDILPCECLNGRRLLISGSRKGIISQYVFEYCHDHGFDPVTAPFLNDDLPIHDAVSIAKQVDDTIFFTDKKVESFKCIPLKPALRIDLVIAWSKRSLLPLTIEWKKKLIDFLLAN